MGGLHYTSGGGGSFEVDLKDGKAPLGVINGIYGAFDAGNIGGVGMSNKNIVIFTAGLRFPITRNWILGAS